MFVNARRASAGESLLWSPVVAAKKKRQDRAGEPSLRKEPTQRRGRERVEAILDAAEHVFAAQGYERATTEAIASRAGASIGSLYQFFPNKRALFDALAARHIAQVQVLFDTLLMPLVGTATWREIVALTIEGFWRFQCDSPGFRAVWVHGSLSQQLLEQGDAINRTFAERIEGLIALVAPEVPRERRAAVAQAAVETASALLFVAARREPREAKALVAETKIVVEAYLETVLAGAGAAVAAREKPARKSRTSR